LKASRLKRCGETHQEKFNAKPQDPKPQSELLNRRNFAFIVWQVTRKISISLASWFLDAFALKRFPLAGSFGNPAPRQFNNRD
jgi:hypothetical protein